MILCLIRSGYDGKKHDENSFKQRLKETLSNFSNRRRWKYVGVWERSPEKKRLHFHGLFYIPDGTMPGELQEVNDFIQYIKDPAGVIYVMNGPAGDQARSEVYKHDDSLYAYARVSQASSWAEFVVGGETLTVTVKTANSGEANDIISWGIKKSA